VNPQIQLRSNDCDVIKYFYTLASSDSGAFLRDACSLFRVENRYKQAMKSFKKSPNDPETI